MASLVKVLSCTDVRSLGSLVSLSSAEAKQHHTQLRVTFWNGPDLKSTHSVQDGGSLFQCYLPSSQRETHRLQSRKRLPDWTNWKGESDYGLVVQTERLWAKTVTGVNITFLLLTLKSKTKVSFRSSLFTSDCSSSLLHLVAHSEITSLKQHEPHMSCNATFLCSLYSKCVQSCVHVYR